MASAQPENPEEEFLPNYDDQDEGTTPANADESKEPKK
jgi:hypothetical protein